MDRCWNLVAPDRVDLGLYAAHDTAPKGGDNPDRGDVGAGGHPAACNPVLLGALDTGHGDSDGVAHAHAIGHLYDAPDAHADPFTHGHAVAHALPF